MSVAKKSLATTNSEQRRAPGWLRLKTSRNGTSAISIRHSVKTLPLIYPISLTSSHQNIGADARGRAQGVEGLGVQRQ